MKNTEVYKPGLQELAYLLHALSHPARLQILMYLSEYKSCPAGNISEQLPISKSTVSQHMSKLREAGLISCTPDGVCQNYRLDDEKFALVQKYFSDFSILITDRQNKKKDCCPEDKFGRKLNPKIKTQPFER